MKDYTVQVPGFVRQATPRLKWRVKGARQVYLTFDDGPTPIVTEHVLDVLKSYGVKGTFFCIGRNVERHPDIFEELKKQGMGIGNHTYSHLNGWKNNLKTYYEDVKLADDLVGSDLFRPAYGRLTPAQTKQLVKEYTIYMWDVLTKDYHHKLSGQDCFENVKNHVRDGSIIVFHDSLKAQRNLEYALPKTIEFLLKQGYSLNDVLKSDLA